MPADHSAAAAALSLSTSSPLSSPRESTASSSSQQQQQQQQQPPPPWARQQRPRRPSASRRLSRGLNPNARGPAKKQPLAVRVVRTLSAISRQLWTIFLRLPRIQQVAVAVAAIALPVTSILFLVYSHAIFTWLGPIAKSWRALPFGWAIIWVMAFASAFPPMIGYSTSVTLAGLVYGVGAGWPIAASATIAGSTCAFLTSRGIFSGYVHGLVGTDKRFVALGQVLRRDGLLVLTGVRFCPLPYSLSNGFLATIPTIRPWAFALATAFVSPKLLIHVFIGSRLALLAEEGDSMSTRDKVINYVGMAVGGLVGATVGILIYRRTMARAAELAREEADGPGGELRRPRRSSSSSADHGGAEAAGEYDDEDSERAGLMGALMDPDDAEADAAALMDDDDISLWGADEFESNGAAAAGGGYRDEEAAIEGDGVGGRPQVKRQQSGGSNR